VKISPCDGQESQQVGSEIAPGNNLPELNRIYAGDCIEVMKTWPENFVDSIITDPPYGLSFMGKDWDHGVPGPHFWAEALRIAKPGALLLAFGGTRTYHRQSVAIEDAGWEIRDCLMWLYGSGFPKSLDISKAIDKAKGAERYVIGTDPQAARRNKATSKFSNLYGDISDAKSCPLTAPATDLAKQWNGWGTALKPAWEPIIVAMKPTDGTFAQNAEKWGVAGINVDGGRIAHSGEKLGGGGSKVDHDGWGKSLCSKTDSAKAEALGRWPANLILDGEAAAMLDGQTGEVKVNAHGPNVTAGKSVFGIGQGGAACYSDSGGASRFFYVAKADRAERNEGCDELEVKPKPTLNEYAKPSEGRTAPKNGSPAANHHPTVKPLSLMKYLCNLTRTPTGGIVLDPFCGSGTTLWAAEYHNRPWLGIEMNPEYVAIAEARIARERSQVKLAI
jgi:DNA modification methylase